MKEYSINGKFLLKIPEILKDVLSRLFSDPDLETAIICNLQKNYDGRYLSLEKRIQGIPISEKLHIDPDFIVQIQIPNFYLTDISKIQKYDPNNWNDQAKTNPPQGIPMRVQFKKYGEDEFGYLCLVWSNILKLWLSPKAYSDCNYSSYDTYGFLLPSDCEFIKFRPWDN